MNSAPKYRIAWLVPSTGATGHGTALFTFGQALDICRELDRQQKDIKHSPELIATEQPSEAQS